MGEEGDSVLWLTGIPPRFPSSHKGWADSLATRELFLNPFTQSNGGLFLLYLPFPVHDIVTPRKKRRKKKE